MASQAPSLTKSEWRQVSRIAAGLSLPRRLAHEPDQSVRLIAMGAGLNDRSAAALQQLLRAIAF